MGCRRFDRLSRDSFFLASRRRHGQSTGNACPTRSVPSQPGPRSPRDFATCPLPTRSAHGPGLRLNTGLLVSIGRVFRDRAAKGQPLTGVAFLQARALFAASYSSRVVSARPLRAAALGTLAADGYHGPMDLDRIDEAVLALLYLGIHQRHRAIPGARAWKSHDWDAMDRLHVKGLISDPATKPKSVMLTEERYLASSFQKKSRSREFRRPPQPELGR